MGRTVRNVATVRMVAIVTTYLVLVHVQLDGEELYVTSPVHRGRMGLNANPRANAKMGDLVIL